MDNLEPGDGLVAEGALIVKNSPPFADLSILRLLRQTFRLTWSWKYWLFVIGFVFGMIDEQLGLYLYKTFGRQGESWSELKWTMMPSSFINPLIAAFIYTLLLRNQGGFSSIWTGIGVALRLWLPLIGLEFLTGCLIILGLLFVILPGIVVSARLSLANVMLVAERRGLRETVAESWKLTQGHTLKLLGFFLSLVLLVLALIAAASFAYGALYEAFPDMPEIYLDAFFTATTAIPFLMFNVAAFVVYDALGEGRNWAGDLNT